MFRSKTGYISLSSPLPAHSPDSTPVAARKREVRFGVSYIQNSNFDEKIFLSPENFGEFGIHGNFKRILKMRAEIEPPSYSECTPLVPPALTLDIKSTGIYTPCTNHERNKQTPHYRITSNLNRDFVKGGFALFRTSPWKPSEGVEVFDVRAVEEARFLLTGLGCKVVTIQRKFGFSGHSWEVKQLTTSSHLPRIDDRGNTILTAKRTSKEDGTLRWCDAGGSLIATDTKLVRRRGNHEKYFQMPVLTIVADIEQEMLDVLVAAWLARVWVEVVQAKKKTLMDGACS